MMTFFIHQLLFFITKPYYNRFQREAINLKKTQLKILKSIIGTDELDEFRNTYSLTSYEDYSSLIEEMLLNNKEAQFVPTSGSTSAIKWIPYTHAFKKELFKASSVWIHDLYLRYPKLKTGKHYWSLSWLPKEIRKSQRSSDVDFFSGLEKWCLAHTMAATDSLMETETLKESMLETLIILINKKITLISVWSPTFLIEMLDLIIHEKDYLIPRVHNKQKKKIISQAKVLDSFILQILFPDLLVVSSWDSSSSAYYAEKLKKYFSHAQFEAKGLWTTEGVVTFPLEKRNVLAYQSHFYEFKNIETKQILFSWELKKGMLVSPILTTGSDFKRYVIDDLCKVIEINNGLPVLEFKVRIGSTDLVGEKISTQVAESILNKINKQFSCKGICLIAHQVDQPYYELLIEGQSSDLAAKDIQDYLETSLCEHFHYKLARELNQLAVSRVRLEEHAHLAYIKIKGKSVKILGNIKIEPLILNSVENRVEKI